MASSTCNTVIRKVYDLHAYLELNHKLSAHWPDQQQWAAGQMLVFFCVKSVWYEPTYYQIFTFRLQSPAALIFTYGGETLFLPQFGLDDRREIMIVN